MLRPSTSRGLPALGCADSCEPGHGFHALDRVEHRRRIRRRSSRRPTDAPRASSSGVKRSGGVPSSVWPSSSGRHLRDDRLVGHGADRRRSRRRSRSGRGTSRARTDRRRRPTQRLPPARGSISAPRRRRSCPRLDADARAGRSRPRRRSARGPRAARSSRPCALMACSLSAMPNDPSLMRLAPNVLVSMMSAPARTYS